MGPFWEHFGKLPLTEVLLKPVPEFGGILSAPRSRKSKGQGIAGEVQGASSTGQGVPRVQGGVLGQCGVKTWVSSKCIG